MQVTVKAKKDGSPNTIFKFQCSGNSSHFHTMLLTKDGKVNRGIDEVCTDKFVRVAFNQEFDSFEVNTETNALIEYPMKVRSSFHGKHAWPWEILSSFFANNKLTPTFKDCNQTWGSLDEDTGLWNGAVAMVKLLVYFLL